MAFDFSKLRGKIIEQFGTLDKFSQRLGTTSTTLGRKLSGKSEWTQREITKSCELLGIPANELTDYFFTH